MDYTGKIKDVSRDFKTNKYKIMLEINEVPAEIDKLFDVGVDITIKKHREKRSLDANAYAWVLMQKIAEAIGSDKWTVYINMLQRYSRAFTHVIVKEKAVERMKELYRACVDLGEVNVNGTIGHQLQVYYGSSTFDTKEMSVLIDGIISECQELGIETLTPDELERMKNVWGKKCDS